MCMCFGITTLCKILSAAHYFTEIAAWFLSQFAYKFHSLTETFPLCLPDGEICGLQTVSLDALTGNHSIFSMASISRIQIMYSCSGLLNKRLCKFDDGCSMST